MQTKTLYRLASLLVLISLVISTNLVAYAATSTAPAQLTTDFTFSPVADAYVTGSTPDSNYGASASLQVDNTSPTRSYLRFAVVGLNGGVIQSAKLRIYANSSSDIGYSVYAVADDNWAEDAITFNNSPAVGNNLNNSQPFNGGVWTEVDISSYIQAEGSYNLAIATSSAANTDLASRESGNLAPQLVVTSFSPETATPTSTTTPTLVPTDSPTATSVPTLVPTNIPALTSTPTQTVTNVPTLAGVPTLGAAKLAGTDWQPSFPIRAAFYYPWFPQAWTQKSIYPYTNYTPSLGYYSSVDLNIIKKHIDMMQYGNIQAGISSWWGQGHHTDTKFAGLLSAAAGTNFRWSLYYENESQGDPSVSQIQNDLTYIRDHYGNDPSFLRVGGKFVVFVYADANDACGMADRWKQANTVGAYIVLKVFPGYATCANQPDSWHQYSPAVATDRQGSFSYSISPGFWLKGQSERLARDITRWTQNVKDMVASGANWQLVTTFSEWGEGTAVEPAAEWASASGCGQYLDALHLNGNITVPVQTSIPQPTKVNTPTATSTPGQIQIQNLTFIPVADSYVNAVLAGANYGRSTFLRVDASPAMKSYLRFTVQGLGGQAIRQVRLSIYANSSSTQGLVAQNVANNSWDETTLNAVKAPATGSTLASSPAVSGGTWVTLDVTSYVTGEGTFSFGISTPGTTAISLSSRESGANAPKLIVSINGSPAPSTISTPTATPVVNPTKTSTPVPTAISVNSPTPTPNLPTAPTPGPSNPPSASVIQHVFVVVMENHSYNEVWNTSASPYITSLGNTYARATNYHASIHPSLPNYLDLYGGSNYSITTDCNPSSSCHVNAPNLADNLEAKGLTWKGYMESMPSPCYLTTSGTYAPKHNPMVYFDDIRNDATRCNSHDVPYTAFAGDLASAATTPNYALIVPNLCNDMHDCSIAAGDIWLKNNIPTILSSSACTVEKCLLILTWDEDDGSQSNQVLTIFAGSGARTGGVTSSVAYTHFSLLHTIENIFGLPTQTSKDAAASPMTDMLR